MEGLLIPKHIVIENEFLLLLGLNSVEYFLPMALGSGEYLLHAVLNYREFQTRIAFIKYLPPYLPIYVPTYT